MKYSRKLYSGEIAQEKENFGKLKTEFLKNFGDELEKLDYHNKSHTLKTLEHVELLAKLERILPSEERYWDLKIAALYHDVGQTIQSKGHEKISSEYLESLLSRKGYNPMRIKNISKMIPYTEMPQRHSKDICVKILQDADLYSFGRDNFFENGGLLRSELEKKGIMNTNAKWYQSTLKILKVHKFKTKSAKKLLNQKKRENVKTLKKLISNPPRLDKTILNAYSISCYDLYNRFGLE